MTIESSHQVNGYDVETAIRLIGPANFGSRSTCCLNDFLISVIKHIAVTIMRILNLICGDHQWYNNNTARQIVEDYYRDPQDNLELRDRIDHLYSLLQYRANGEVSYAEGIQVPQRDLETFLVPPENNETQAQTEDTPSIVNFQQELFREIESCFKPGYEGLIIWGENLRARILISLAELLLPSDPTTANVKLDRASHYIDEVYPELKAERLLQMAKVKAQISIEDTIETLRQAAISAENISILQEIAQEQIKINPELANETLQLANRFPGTSAGCSTKNKIIEIYCYKAIKESQENEEQAAASLQEALRIAEELSNDKKIKALFYIVGVQLQIRGQDPSPTFQRALTFAAENQLYLPSLVNTDDYITAGSPEIILGKLSSLRETVVNSIDTIILIMNIEDAMNQAYIEILKTQTQVDARAEILEYISEGIYRDKALIILASEQAKTNIHAACDIINLISSVYSKDDGLCMLVAEQAKINIRAARELIDLISGEDTKINALCILAEAQAQIDPTTCSDILTEALDLTNAMQLTHPMINYKHIALSRITKAFSQIGITHFSGSFITRVIDTIKDSTIVRENYSKDLLNAAHEIVQAIKHRPDLAGPFADCLVNRAGYYLPLGLQLKIQLNPAQAMDILLSAGVNEQLQMNNLNAAAQSLSDSNPLQALNLYQLSMGIPVDEHEKAENIIKILNSLKDVESCA